MITAVKLYSKTRLKLIASLLMVVLLILPPLVNVFVAKANAGTFTNAKLLINNSQAAATGVTYTAQFTAQASTAIKELKIVFCTTASGTCTTPTGMTTTGAAFGSDNVSNSGPSNTFTSNGTLQRDWSGSVVQSPLAVTYSVTNITNPSTINNTSYARITTYSDAGTTPIDTVTVAFAVLDTGSIAVSASVDPNFTFTVAPATTGSVNGDTINVSSTTSNSIPYGSLNSSVASVAAHDITVTTNAANGYTVTASSAATTQAGSPPLVSGAVNNIDNFTGTNASPTTWSAPNGSAANVNTGFFGYTTNNATLCTGSANRFTNSGPNYAGFTTTGQEVACSTTGVTSQTTRLGWKLAINSLQPAGGYTGTIILVATPTY